MEFIIYSVKPEMEYLHSFPQLSSLEVTEPQIHVNS